MLWRCRVESEGRMSRRRCGLGPDAQASPNTASGPSGANPTGFRRALPRHRSDQGWSPRLPAKPARLQVDRLARQRSSDMSRFHLAW